MIQPKKYNLPDVEILAKDYDSYCVWIPDKTYIVLGASNSAEIAVNNEFANRDKIELLKRSSGGQAVILTSQMLVFSVLKINPKQVEPKLFFNLINQKLIEVFEKLGIYGVEQRGISDLTIAGKKILGSAIYRKREKFFYHAVLNVSENPDLIARYLLHPSKEPEYRAGRTHSHFITSINSQNKNIEINKLKNAIEQCLSSFVGG